MATVTVCFTIDNKRDRDLVHWLDSLRNRNRSEAIRNALRQHIGHGDVTLGDVYRVVKRLEHTLQRSAEVPDVPCHQDEECDEPPDIVAALDSLGL